jgi:hypothetical protein
MARSGGRQDLEDDAREDDGASLADTAQKGGSRGSSNQTGPSRGNTRNSRTAIAGTDQQAQTAEKAGGTADPIRGPLPPGATREDYLGGETPHKTREKETKSGTTERAGAKRNEVM